MKFSTVWHDRLDSTNRALKDSFLHHYEIPNGTIVATREQTAGRGRSDRKWLSAPDTNLCFSIFLKTDADLINIPSLTMSVALGITDYLNSRNIAAQPKWPNDILVNGKKICGILSERVSNNGRSGIIIGIGLNVNMTTDEAEAIDRPATSMLIESGKAYDLSETLEKLLPSVDHWISEWERGGFSAIRNTWTEKAGPIGKPLKVHDGDRYKAGTLAGFGEHGELLLQTSAGLETIWSGDVS